MAGARYRLQNKPRSSGSALILTVVLTSLLAIVGILFLLASRMNRSATKATEDVKRLEVGVDQVLSRIKQQLILDVPGVAGQEYYDSADVNNPWLASLEPAIVDGQLLWPQISDLTERIGGSTQQSVALVDRGDPNVDHVDYRSDAIVGEYDPIDDTIPLNSTGLLDHLADADGDGVADAKWFVLDHSDPYKPVFAAVRIVDHGAMLNVNTAFAWDRSDSDPSDPNVILKVDGSNQGQIDLLRLVNPVEEENWPGYEEDINDLWQFRMDWQIPEDGINSRGWPQLSLLYQWQNRTVWHFSSMFPQPYAPFDLADEVRLRYRYVLNFNRGNTRIENLWSDVYERGRREMPFGHRNYESVFNLDRWQQYAGTTVSPRDYTHYDFRHISTAVNGDRLIRPRSTSADPLRMVDINRRVQFISTSTDRAQRETRINDWVQTMIRAASSEVPDAQRDPIIPQLAVNLIDFADEDKAGDANQVTVWEDNDGTRYYGFERQPFIRQIRVNISEDTPNDVSTNSYLVELYNPFKESIDLYGMSIRFEPGIGSDPKDDIDLIDGSVWLTIPGEGSLFILNTSAAGDLLADEPRAMDPNKSVVYEISDFTIAEYETPINNDARLKEFYHLGLVRRVPFGVGEDIIYLDYQENVEEDFRYSAIQSAQRYVAWERGDVDTWEVIEPEWRRKGADGILVDITGTGRDRNYNLADPNTLLRVPAFADDPADPDMTQPRLTRVGDILRILTLGPGTSSNRTVGQQLMDAPHESRYRIDLRGAYNPYTRIFQHLTVLDPNRFNAELPENEMRVKGRININTAPWFVLSLLPWISSDLAVEIVNQRDRAFTSIGELMRVDALSMLANDTETRQYDERNPSTNLFDYPDFTDDDAEDDLEETHLLFSAISNLITVRSDVFSAYIVVRIGFDGPQRRVYALLDRSDVERSSDHAQVLLRQKVPEPR